MVKFKKLFVLVIAIVSTLVLASCGESNSHEQDNVIYNITCDESDYYSFGGTKNATAGQKASVQLTSQFPAYVITGCTFNGNECIKTSGEDATTQIFEYTMPQSSVEIKVLNKWKDLSVSGKEDFLKFNNSNDYTMKSAYGDTNYNNDIILGNPFCVLFELFDGEDYNMTEGATGNIIDCFSTNEDILPSTAIEIKNTMSSSSNSIIGGTIIIDRSKARAGTTQIVLRVKSGNRASYDAIIVQTITIEE